MCEGLVAGRRARPLKSYMHNLRISSDRLISLDAYRRDSEHVTSRRNRLERRLRRRRRRRPPDRIGGGLRIELRSAPLSPAALGFPSMSFTRLFLCLVTATSLVTSAGAQPAHKDPGPQIQAEYESASHALAICTRGQVRALAVTSETAEAVARAALTLCRAELTRAAQAAHLWIGRASCIPGSQTCRDSEQAFTKNLVPVLAAIAMKLRADGLNSAQPQHAPSTPK